VAAKAPAAKPKKVAAAADGFVIEARRVTKSYDTGKLAVDALRGLDLKVRRGEVLSVMGPSGCGKTTLLNCLSGLDDVTEGSVLIEGKDIARLNDDTRTDFRARRMGFVFQAYNLMPVLTAAENVELPLLLAGVAPAEAREKAHAALRTMNLSKWEDHKPAEMSGGQQQRVAIARALVNDPAILWADEPTGNLDTANALKVIDLLLGVGRSRRQTIVLVTHDPKVGARADRVVMMDSGRIVGEEKGEGTGPAPAEKKATATRA
jgi:putative ABC transport system ATP-binding protein